MPRRAGQPVAQRPVVRGAPVLEGEATRVFEHYREWVDDWEAFQAAVARPLPNCIWTNTLRLQPDELRRSLARDGIRLEPLPWHRGAFRFPADVAPGRPWQYRAGLYHVQEEASLLPVACAPIRLGDRVLDLCAAPGNKTAQLAVALADTGTVVANDRSGERTRALRHTIERLGLVNVAVTVWDGKRFPMPDELFDGVLVDAPCSCEGTVRKSSRDARVVDRAEIESIAVVQTILLRRAVKLVKPGGWVVYSTCTFSPLENECVVDAVVGHRRSEMTLESVQLPGFTASPGLSRWEERSFSPGMTRCLRVWPHTQDTGGFFVALLRRKRSTESGVPSRRQIAASSAGGLLHDPDLVPVFDRFGIPMSILAKWTSPAPTRGKLYVAPSEFAPPTEPAADSYGFLALNTDMRFPKLTTGATLRWGNAATRNRVVLSTEQRDLYLTRQMAWLTADQVLDVTGRGYVVVSYGGWPLGVGFFDVEDGRPRVSSMYPRGWVM